MLGKLIPCGGGPPIALVKPTLVVGRNPESDVRLLCRSVSGRHCELRFRDGFWWARDLGSKNGTAVNGARCEQRRLAPEDTLSFGAQRFVLAYPSAEKPARPPGANLDIEDLAADYLTGRDETSATPPRPALPRPLRPSTHTAPGVGKLVPCGGGDPIALIPPETLLGRSPACDVCLRFPTVSGKHCKLTWRDGYWFVTDLNSSNGTSVNGVRCRRKCLPPGSVLALAQHRFTAHYTPTADAPPPDEEDVFAQGLLEKLGLSKKLGAGGPSARTAAGDDPDLNRKRYSLEPDEEP
jgi:adenylate cyclase